MKIKSFTLVELLVAVPHFAKAMWDRPAILSRHSFFAKAEAGKATVSGVASWRRRTARVTRFTLIELLVVIAIIAILMALMLPALKGAKDSAKTVMCMGNLKQMGAGMLNYSLDWDGAFPTRLHGSGLFVNFWFYQLCLATTGEYKGNGRDPILLCPARTEISGPRIGTYTWVDYRICGYLWQDYHYLTEIQDPANTPYLGETSANMDACSVSNIDWLRHYKKANFLFIDGHAQLARMGDHSSYKWH